MNTFIREEVGRLLHKAGVKEVGELATPPKAEMGDVAFPCFTLSKTLGKNPAEIAKEIASKITGGGLVERVGVFGPYVNFILSPSAVIGEVVGEVLKKKKDYGALTSGKGKKVLLEYPSNNTHKEFHIGHLRNVCIGNALVQLCQKNGYKVYPVNYLNDFGNHVARCLWGLLKFHKDERPPGNRQKWLGDIYAEASQKVKENPE